LPLCPLQWNETKQQKINQLSNKKTKKKGIFEQYFRSRGVFVTHFVRYATKIRNKNLLLSPEGRKEKRTA
jgi:hypothetical protein